MATTDDFGAAPPDAAGHRGAFTRPDELAQIERDVHEEPTATNQDPARPGGRGSMASMLLWGALFLAIVAFFVYAFAVA